MNREEWIESKLSQMNLEEKALQLAAFYPNGNERLNVPYLSAGECLHGMRADECTVFPQAIALGATWDVDLVEKVGNVIAKEGRAVGAHLCFAPLLGVLRDVRWGRTEEGYGEDPYLVGKIGAAYINGLQGREEKRFDENHVVATAKHFVADGEPMAGMNGASVEISDRMLREVHLLPFEMAVKEAKVGAIMPAHHSVNGVPCHANKYLIDEVLRKEFGFDGVVVSDNNDIPRLHALMSICEDYTQAAKLALEAGVDMELAFANSWDSGRRPYGSVLVDGVTNGIIPEELLDQAVRRVLGCKYDLRLLEDSTGENNTPEQKAFLDIYNGERTGSFRSLAGTDKFFGRKREGWEAVLQNPENDRLALEAARKAIVLLKNENNVLPLTRGQLKTVAVIGPNSDRTLLGGYSNTNPRYFVSVLEGIRKFLNDGNDSTSTVDVIHANGCNPDILMEEDIEAAVQAAAKADVVIAVIGGNEKTCRENQDIDTMELHGDQMKLMKAVCETGAPVVVVLLHGRPASVEWLKEHAAAILEGFYLGQECGNAVAEVLFGAYNPGGKLPLTVPRNVGQLPHYYNELPLGRPSNYYAVDKKNKSHSGGSRTPLYPFGYGLSYTTFEISKPMVYMMPKETMMLSSATIPGGTMAEQDTFLISEDMKILVKVEVKNTGDRAGEEVVQLYIHDKVASLTRPCKELKGFQRISLQRNEKAVITFELNYRSFAFWNQNTWTVEPGEFEIMIGPDSKNLKMKTILFL